MEAHMQSLAEAVDIGFVNPDDAEFFFSGGGFLGLKYKEKEYNRVSLRRALPVGNPESYISVADSENKEICIIKDVAGLSPAQAGIVRAELDKRYFCPEVRAIKSVKDKLGYVYMELDVLLEGAVFSRNCAIKDVSKNIRALDDNRILLFDVDGNRFIINSFQALDKKSQKGLEPYLF